MPILKALVAGEAKGSLRFLGGTLVGLWPVSVFK